MFKVYLDDNTGNILIDGVDTHPYTPNDLIATNNGGYVDVYSQNNQSYVLIAYPYTDFVDKDSNALGADIDSTVTALNDIFSSAITIGQGLSLVEVNIAIANYLIANPIQSDSYFPIWAEENSSLGTSALEWAFGNGANTPNDQGVVLPFACELTHASLSLQSGSATVGIYKNGVKVYDIVSTGMSTGATLLTPVSFAAGDAVGFQTTIAVGTSSPNVITAWFKK